MNNVVLITSGQPTANPRLVKEALVLLENGYNVTVIYCPLSPWADTLDQQLFKRHPQIKWICVGSHPIKNPFGYRLARVRRILYEFVFNKLGNYIHAPENAMVLFGQELKKAACSCKANMYIGHNLGALPAVVTAARKYGATAVFDFEDYHRGENPPHTKAAMWVRLVEEKYVKHLAYATAASPLITEAYRAHFPTLSVQTINNCFPRSYAPESLLALPHHPLRLFWFSQYVGKNRGVEQVLAAMGKTGTKAIELSMLGNCTTEMKDYFTGEAIKNGVAPTQLHFLPPVPEPDIVRIASQHHIGIAAEVPHIVNREYCLTNKIFMYLLAGNAILFSNTRSQEKFLQHHTGIGSLFTSGDIEQIASILTGYYNDPDLLKRQRQAAYQLGQICNWDTERERFLELLNAQL